MKKVFLFLLVTCSLALTSCSEDDSDEVTAEEIAEATDTNGNSIIGLWTLTETETEEGVTITETKEFKFNADKTGHYISTETGEEDINIEFTWTKVGDDYTMTGGGETAVITIVDSDGTLALLDDDGDIMALKQ